MSDNNQKAVENNELSIELTEDVAEGVYANLALITHSSSEFVLDFIRVVPGLPKAKVKSRVILAPEHALRLLGALQENLRQYEAKAIAAANAQQAGAPVVEEQGSKDFPYPLDFNPKGEA